jgi:hypothetical protein
MTQDYSSHQRGDRPDGHTRSVRRTSGFVLVADPETAQGHCSSAAEVELNSVLPNIRLRPLQHPAGVVPHRKRIRNHLPECLAIVSGRL